MLKFFGIILFFLFALYGLLLIPSSTPDSPKIADKQPFAWNQDSVWESLEKEFIAAKEMDCLENLAKIDTAIAAIHQFLDNIAQDTLPPEATQFALLERQFFQLGPQIGACEERLTTYMNLFSKIRKVVKDQSVHWDMKTSKARNTIYRLLYGGRAGIEELMLQAHPENVSPMLLAYDEPSQTPSIDIMGVKAHSGDMLVSRGGAPTSALISRGNDYPGNFSHVSLLHVDENSGETSIVESWIEKGVFVNDFESYVNDKKLRMMILRPRADLPALQKNPMLPHEVADSAKQVVETQHIPYDFAMNYTEPSKQFCAEVVSSAYGHFGIDLWMGLSTISSPGLARWLSLMGVQFFETHEPSDLEYDPQLTVVAEWRGLETLYQDHLDNAMIDIMLEGAEAGEGLPYDWHLLPFGRLAKGYSAVLNWMGKEGPVPEGMSATTAMRVRKFIATHHALRDSLKEKAKIYEAEHGYHPPYWDLVNLAREVKNSGL
ncbi:MAG: YiiX/YebB-like N1pC/P60 family cysteine hydrolase [Chitinophagales bacterium]